jgi:hypothetical protein
VAVWQDLAFCWSLLTQEAAARKAHWLAHPSTQPWSEDRELVGLAGEVAYALTFGWPGPLVDRPRAPDGGHDFGYVDVKAVPRWRDPSLIRDLRMPTKAPRYALVAVDLDASRGTVVGEATRAELLAAPTRDFGHGPAHVLPAAALHPARHYDEPPEVP